VFVTDDDGGVSSAATQITIATAPGGPNLVGNPSFEVSNAGWAPFNGSTLQRIAGGFDGSWSMSMTGPASTATFGATDAPNWVGTTTAAGIRYRFSAWVRSSAGTGQVRLRVREYLNGVRIGATGYFSNMVDLTPDWTELTLDYVSQTAGSTLDLQVEDVPLKVSEEFDVDNLAIWVVPATPPALASRAPEEGPGAPLASATAEEPVLDLDSAAPFWKVRVVGADAQGVPRFTRLALRVEGREVAASEVTEGPAGASMEVLFDRHDLKTLFAGLAGSPRVTATLIGDQISGTVTLGTLALEVVGAAQPLRPVLTSNPMRASGTIGFATSREGPLQADLFDASGRRVRRLMGRAGAARGWHDVSVDGRDEGGVALGAGIYFYRIVSVDGVATGRLVLLK
jgi:hypothetical protein